ncbi:hypothetical protein [Streptomyces sp. CC224B]|uniref:hypothetical protein n=1 Tax=Streptomyces sp. CC224B TaxID=3044571 RepID=UPI0024A9052F|nr:hypothetical protein [Streptomyces sp. CC224B]
MSTRIVHKGLGDMTLSPYGRYVAAADGRTILLWRLTPNVTSGVENVQENPQPHQPRDAVVASRFAVSGSVDELVAAKVTRPDGPRAPACSSSARGGGLAGRES